MSFFQMSTPLAARRLFLGRSGGLVSSGVAVALLAGNDALAAQAGSSKAGDVQILNTALGAELEAIAAYQLGAESKLLSKPVLDLALTFQGHHKQHVALLSSTVEKLGGKPAPARARYNFPVDQLKTELDVRSCSARRDARRAALCALRSVPRAGPGSRWAEALRFAGSARGQRARLRLFTRVKTSSIVWNEKTLNRFLSKPLAMVPRSSMTCDGVPSASDRGDLVAYLKAANAGAACGR